MKQSNQNKLFNQNEKQHYRMYKSGKKWIFQRISTLALVLGAIGLGSEINTNKVNADTKTDNSQISNNYYNKNDNTFIDSTNKSNDSSADNKNKKDSDSVDSTNKNNDSSADNKNKKDSDSVDSTNKNNDSSADNKNKKDSDSVDSTNKNNDSSVDNKNKKDSDSVDSTNKNNDSSVDNKNKKDSDSVDSTNKNNDSSVDNKNKKDSDSVDSTNKNNDSSVDNKNKKDSDSVDSTNKNNDSSVDNKNSTNKNSLNLKNEINSGSIDSYKKSLNKINSIKLSQSDVDKQQKEKVSNNNNNGTYPYKATISVKVYDDKNKQTSTKVLNKLNPFFGNANTMYSENIDKDPNTRNKYIENLEMPTGSTITGGFELYFDKHGQGHIINNTLTAKTPAYKNTETSVPVNLHDEKDPNYVDNYNTVNVNYPIGGYVGANGVIYTDDNDIIKASNGKIPSYYSSGKFNGAPIRYSVNQDGVHLFNSSNGIDMYSGQYYNNIPLKVPVSISDGKKQFHAYFRKININVSGYANENNIPVSYKINDLVKQLNDQYNLGLPNNCSWNQNPNTGDTNDGTVLVNMDSNGNPTIKDNQLGIITPNYQQNINKFNNLPKGIIVDPTDGYNGSTTTIPAKNPDGSIINGGSITITVNDDGSANVTKTNLPPYTNSANVAIPIVVTDKKDNKTYNYNDTYYTKVSGYVGNPVNLNGVNSQQVINSINQKQGTNLPNNSTVSIDSKSPIQIMINENNLGHVINGHVDVVTPNYENNVKVNVPVQIIDNGNYSGETGSYATNVSGYDGNTYSIPQYDQKNVYHDITLPDNQKLPNGTITTGNANVTINGNNSYNLTSNNMKAKTPSYVHVPVSINVILKDSNNKVTGIKKYNTNINGYIGNNVSYEAGSPHDQDIINQLNLPNETVTSGHANIYINSNNSSKVINDSVVAQDPSNVENIPVTIHVKINNPNENDGQPTFQDYKDDSLKVSGYTGNYTSIRPDKVKILNSLKLSNSDKSVATIDDNGNDQVIIKQTNSEYDGIVVNIPKYEKNVAVKIPVKVNDDGHQYDNKQEYYNTTVSGYDGTSSEVDPSKKGDSIVNNLNKNNDKSLPVGTTESGTAIVKINGNNETDVSNDSMNVTTPKYINVNVNSNVNVIDKNGNHKSETYKTNASGYVNNSTSLNPNSDDVKNQLHLPSDTQISGNPTFTPTTQGSTINADGSINARKPYYVDNVPVNVQVRIHDSKTNKDYIANYRAPNIKGYTGDSSFVSPNISDVNGKLTPIDDSGFPFNNGLPNGSTISGNATATINNDGKSSTVNNDNIFINTPKYINNLNVKVNVIVNTRQGYDENKSYTTNISGYADNNVTIDGEQNSKDVVDQLNLPNGTNVSKDAIIHINSDSTSYSYEPQNNSLLATDPEYVKLPISVQVPVTDKKDNSVTYKTYNTFIQGYVGNKSNDTVPNYKDMIKQFNLPNGSTASGVVSGYIYSPTHIDTNSTIKAETPDYDTNVPVVIPVNIHDNNRNYKKNYNTTVSGYAGSTINVEPDRENVIKQFNLPDNSNVSGSANVQINSNNTSDVSDNDTNVIIPNSINPNDNNESGNNYVPNSDNNSNEVIGGNTASILPGSNENNVGNDSNINTTGINNNMHKNTKHKGNSVNINHNNIMHFKNEFKDVYLNYKKPLIKIAKSIKFITKHNKVIKYSPKNHPIFRLIGFKKLNDGKAIFKVSMRGVKGHFFAKTKDVKLAYYTNKDMKKHSTYYLKSIHGDFSHENRDFENHINKGLKSGQYKKVAKVVKHGEITRFKLANGHYLTSNKYYVKLTTSKPTKYIMH